MRELHVVAVSDDGRHVVLTGGDEGEEFLVPLDDRLRAVVREDLGRTSPVGEDAPSPAPSAPPAPRSTVTPKQIQARLRAGETVEQIADSAGMPVAKVERFAWPVVSEQERMITGTRAAVLVRSRRGPSALPIGDAVAEHLQDLGLPADATTWTARREESGRWLVQVSFVAKARTRTAGWRFEPSTGEVSPVDPYSTALGYADAPVSHSEAAPAAPGRRVAAASPSRPAASRGGAAKAPRDSTTAQAGTPAKAPAAKTARARATAAPLKAPPGSKVRVAQPARPTAPTPATGGTLPTAAPASRPKGPPAAKATRVAKPTRAAKATAEASTPPPAATTPSATTPQPPHGPPTLRVVRPPAAAENASVDTGPADAAPADAAPVPEATPAEATPAEATTAETAPTQAAPTQTAPTQAAPARPAPAQQAPARRAAGGRASVPAWADVLLGTAPVHRPADPDDAKRD